MKQGIQSLCLLAAVLLAACTEDKSAPDFTLDREQITVGATGATEQIQLSIDGEWIASTDASWVTISPANGRGSTPCRFLIDSALTAEPRQAVVRIQSTKDWEERTITIAQEGYPYSIEVDSEQIELANYEALGKRHFEVRVRSNVDFKVQIPSDAKWLQHKNYELNLNRGLRPREVTIRFDWDINTAPQERLAEVSFQPKEQVTLHRQDKLSVKQGAADPIEADTRAGDSVALLCISRTLNPLDGGYDASQPMSKWNGVALWEEGDKGYTPEKAGRVRYVEFMLYNLEEDIPFEVSYLTAAEEIYFFGNTNTFMRSLSTGEAITKLTQLKRLTIGAHGLTTLHPDFKKLVNLEHLNLCANNFQTVPDQLTKENFPALRTLILNANQRSTIYDLSNTTRTDIGGFIDEKEFPVDLIKWNLDTLVLSVNYLQGKLPTFEDDDTVPVYTQEDINAVDTLPQYLVDHKIKKVMTRTKRFAINLNRLSGELPDWLLYHPALDLWIPYSLVFPQEGRGVDGTQAIFSNEPVNLNYYYDIYTKKTRPLDEEDLVE